jgi:hypothetical protein
MVICCCRDANIVLAEDVTAGKLIAKEDSPGVNASGVGKTVFGVFWSARPLNHLLVGGIIPLAR